MKNILKSVLVMALALGTTAIGTGAYFTSTVSANNNQIIAGTLRLGIDSTQVHSGGWHIWGFPYAYTVVQDVNGVNTQYSTLETWMNAAPALYAPFTHVAGIQTFPDGNYSYWVAFRNAGTIPMKVKGNVTGGSWTVSPAVNTADPVDCTNANLNAQPTVTVRNVHFYANDNCEGQQECENIYYGLKTGPWTNAPISASDYNISGGSVPITTPVYASSNGTSTGTPVQINGQQFIIARVDVNFDNTLAPANVQNCYQGATFNYNLTGSAYQMGDGSW